MTAASSATWSWWWWVSSTCVTVIPSASACSSSGRTGPPASTRKPSPPGPAATRYVFDSQSGCIERSTIMRGTLVGIASGAMELIHTCYRIGDIDRSVAFYEALGFEERRRMPIRDEAINVFMGLPGDGDRLELTYNFGVDSLRARHRLQPHRADRRRPRRHARRRWREKGIDPEKPPYRVARGRLAASASCATRTATGSS